jgi:FdhD protein
MQEVFDKTGGVHACAFYSPNGDLISFAEDVGRHNALDKCMGSVLSAGKSGSIYLILLSSRISFEMIRKSYRTGAVVVAGVSAPTSAAVSAAEQGGVTLVGFLRGERFNVYAHPERLLNL